MAKQKKDSANGDVVESKSDRFRRLANKRLAAFEKYARLLRGLASTATYEYTDKQAEIVCGVVEKWSEEVRAAFTDGKVPTVEKSVYV